MRAALLAALAAAATASPTPTQVLKPRASQCGQWDSISTGNFVVYADLWGESAGTGSQCSTVTAASGNSVSWSTSWSWSGGSSSVKSFSNAVVNFTPKQLSAIGSMPTSWKWSYTGSGIVADVAYDSFLSSSATGSDEYEVMVWLGALGGAGPISSTGSAIATPTVAGVSWQLFYGLNGSMKVYSFVASSKDETDFSGDLLDFYKYLEQSQGLSSSQYLLSVGAGTEPFTGSNAVLTNTYSLSIN